MRKLNIDAADGLFADPPPMDIPPPVRPAVACICCAAEHATARRICPACHDDPMPRLDAAERQVVAQEELLAGWLVWLDAQLAAASLEAQARYTKFETKLIDSITDTALYATIMATVDREIARGTPLGLLFTAMRRADTAAATITKALDHVATIQEALLCSRAARGWSIPDDVHARRLALGRPAAERADTTPKAIRQMRQAGLE